MNIEHLTLTFEGKTVFSDRSFTFVNEKITALMGASGCGKTSLLRVVAGLLRPESGKITDAPTPCAMMFQEPRLFPWLTAAENVNAVLSDKKHTLSTAREWLARVELGADANRYPAELSGGMQQRVSLARALAANAPLLLLDEPFRGLDEALRARMLALVKSETVGKTVLFVTHDESEAGAFGCEIVRM